MSTLPTLAPSEDPLLKRAVARIVADFAPRRIVLFGSRAWGTPGEGSDYDLLVLVDDERAHPRRLAGKIRWAIADLPASFDILVRPHAWWSEHCDLPHSLERRIERDGKVLHVAA